jgi:hypothetical protein
MSNNFFGIHLPSLVIRDPNGNLSANVITATLNGASKTFTDPLIGDISGTQAATKVLAVGGVSADNVASAANSVLEITSFHGTLVSKDANGNLIGTVIPGQIAAINTSLAVESARAQAAEGAIISTVHNILDSVISTADLSNEATRAIDSEIALGNLINAEKTRAIQAETTLTSNLSALSATVSSLPTNSVVNTEIANAVAAEATIARTAEVALGVRIDNVMAGSGVTLTQVNTAVAAEATIARTAETTLTSNLSALSATVSSLPTTSSVNSAVAAEATIARAAEIALRPANQQLGAYATLSGIIPAITVSDTVVTAIEKLDARITSVSGSGSAISAPVTGYITASGASVMPIVATDSILTALEKLDGSIVNESVRATIAENALLASVQTTGYTSVTGSTLASADTIVDAITKLDSLLSTQTLPTYTIAGTGSKILITDTVLSAFGKLDAYAKTFVANFSTANSNGTTVGTTQPLVRFNGTGGIAATTFVGNLTGTASNATSAVTANSASTLNNAAITITSAGAITTTGAINTTSTITASGAVSASNYVTTSDARLKTNIVENVPGLSFISKLRPITYNDDLNGISKFILNGAVPSDEDIKRAKIVKSGFIAQEVEAAANEIGYAFDAINAPPSDDKEYYTLGYMKFVVPLVKACQEQQALITSLMTDIASLKSQNAEILSKL